MSPLLILVLVAIAVVVWNRLRQADDVVASRARRPADGGADAGIVYASAGDGGADCGDGGGGSDGGGGCD